MMEVIPLLTLWLCMPLDRTPPWPTVEERLLFPPLHVVERERERSWQTHRHCCRMYSATGSDYWRKLGAASADEFNAWNELYYAHHWNEDTYKTSCLKLLRDRLGPERYYAGVLPMPAHVSGVRFTEGCAK